MNVTRDVIYDLLPAYFAGEVSSDTRALVEQFFETDPEFGRMASRFRRLMMEQPQNGAPDTQAEREKSVFDRAKARAGLRQAAFIWALGAAFSIVLALLTGLDRGLNRHPGIIIGVVFGVMALATALLSWTARPEHWYALLTEVDPKKPR